MTTTRLETTPGKAAAELANYSVLDVREASEFTGPLGHIAGAIWIPLGELEGRKSELPGDRPLLVVCRSGARSGMACDALAGSALSAPTNLSGGMIAWHQQGLPVERERLASEAEILEVFAIWLARVKRMSLEEARAFVRAQGAAGGAYESFDEAITRLEIALSHDEPVPPDLVIVCKALRADAARLSDPGSPS